MPYLGLVQFALHHTTSQEEKLALQMFPELVAALLLSKWDKKTELGTPG